MRHLAAWSGHRVLGLWLAWLGLLVGLAALGVRRQWQSQARAAQSVLPASLGRQAADSAPAIVSKDERLEAAPEQHTDFVYSVVIDDGKLLKAGLVLFGPPGLLTFLWLYARHRRHPKEPTQHP